MLWSLNGDSRDRGAGCRCRPMQERSSLARLSRSSLELRYSRHGGDCRRNKSIKAVFTHVPQAYSIAPYRRLKSTLGVFGSDKYPRVSRGLLY